jgi:hypothetical protein
MYQLTTLGPTNLLAFQLPGLGFWMFSIFSLVIYVKITFWPHCNRILMNVHSCRISYHR